MQQPTINVFNEENYHRSPSEDSGLGMGISDKNPRIRPPSTTGKSELNDEDHQNQEYVSGDEDDPAGTRSRRHSSPRGSRSGSTTALHQQEYPDSVSFV
ncbi:hypothetical protein JTB14_024529 [Gonioctena quinquepunctata]|nr:hypothetical protein JTB14_024529 [Gonioctena quinquepunctata]